MAGRGNYNRYRGKGRGKRKGGNQTREVGRVRMPRGNEVLGIIMGIMGGSRMKVSCKDGKERMCRIPGRLRNSIRVREGDVVIVEPWVIEGDKKGDVIWKYYPLQARVLKDRGVI